MAATRTVRDLIQRALRVATILGAGETADANDATDALLSFNQMLDAWQAEELFAFAIVERTHALTAGVGTYTVGPGATINVARPVRIQWAFTRDQQNYDRPVRVVPDTVWYLITLKSLGNSFPEALYYQPTYPHGTINLWELPQAGLTLRFGAWEVLTEYTNLSDVVSLPPGYEEALVFSLAERLCPEYGRAIPADLARLAQKARANIQQNNLADWRVTCEFTGERQSIMSYADFIAGNW